MIDKNFQDKVLACMINVPEFMAVASQHITPTEFDGALANNMAKMSLDFFNRYDTTITRVAFIQTIKQMVDKGTIKKTEIGVPSPRLPGWCSN